MGLISVIIPVFNGEKFIKKCILSILEQTYSNFEILVINDGSSDKTQDIVKSINDRRIKLYSKDNTGVSDTRNYGIEKSKGDYIIFIDADDVIDPNLFTKLIKIVNDHKVDIVRYNGYIETKDHKYKKIEFPLENNLVLSTNKNKDRIIDLILNPVNSIRCYSPLLFMVNKNIIKFRTDLSYLEDKVFYLENFLNNKKVMFVNEALYYYNYNESSKTKKLTNFSNNIDNILYTQNLIKSLVTEKYSELVNLSSITLLIYRFEYLAFITNLKTFRNTIKGILKRDNVKELYNIESNKLNKYVNIQFKILKIKLITLFYFICRIKKIIKNK